MLAHKGESFKKGQTLKKQTQQIPFEIGTTVFWRWMGRKVQGQVKRIYVKPIERVFRGSVFKRNGSKDKPAYLVESVSGSEVLKSHSELKIVKSVNKRSRTSSES